MRSYRLHVIALAVVLLVLLQLIGSAFFGLAGVAVATALAIALAWIIYFHSERTVLTALAARPVSEVERPEFYLLVRELCSAARLPVPRLFVFRSAARSVLVFGFSARSTLVCCSERLLEPLSPDDQPPAELRAVLEDQLARVASGEVVAASWYAGAVLLPPLRGFAGRGALARLSAQAVGPGVYR